MEGVIDSIRSIVGKAARTQITLTANAIAGQTYIQVLTAFRFTIGYQIVIRNTSTNQGQFATIADCPVNGIILLTTPLGNNWDMNTSIVEKTFNFQYLQGIYFGEYDIASKYPLVQVSLGTKQNQWLTIRGMKESYQVNINTYVQASYGQLGNRWLIRMTNAIQERLKNNFQMLVAPFSTVAVIADINVGDYIIKVADTSNIFVNSSCLVQDIFNWTENNCAEVLDNTTIRLGSPINFPLLVKNNATFVLQTRNFYNSLPTSVNFGSVFKGTLLRGSTISFMTQQFTTRNNCPGEPNLF